jgi:hypothetical protein
MNHKPPFEIKTPEGISGGKSELTNIRILQMKGIEQPGIPIPSEVFLRQMKMKLFEELDNGGFFEYSSITQLHSNEIEHNVRITVVQPERKNHWETI